MPGKITHFEIMGADGEKLKEFYANLFEWTIDSNNPMSYGLVSPEAPGIGGGIGATPGGDKYVTVYAAVPDIQASLDKAVSLGATMVMPVTTVMEGVTIALFTDPEGNIMGLTQDM